MKLKRLELENIRSYENVEVDFPDGSTLLSGDIGAGKTTILLAVEFALFGLQPGQRGNALLKNGKDFGKIILKFEVDGNDIVIERTLKRGKAISQDACSISINGEKQEISVTELKSRILNLLDYPKEFAKKQNLLYKFTVYTPQEEMKQIILQDSDTRINTLRHVFGIDKYKKILENVSVVASKLREEKRLKEGFIMGIEQDRGILLSKETELGKKKNDLILLENELQEKTKHREKINEEKNEVSKKIEEKHNLEKEIDKTKILLSTKNEGIESNRQKIARIEEQLKEISEIRFDEKDLDAIQNYIRARRQEKDKLTEENVNISSEISSLNLKSRESENVIDKLKVIEVCPTCLQDVNTSYKNNVLGKMNATIEDNAKKIKLLTERKNELALRNEEINREIVIKEKELQDLNLIKFKIDSSEEKQKQIKEIEDNSGSLRKDMQFLNSHLTSLRDNVFSLNKFQNYFDEKQKELDIALREEKIAEIKLAENRKEITLIEQYIGELNDKIKRAEEIKLQLNYLGELENWLSKKFVPLIEHTEKNVMIKLKVEFSRFFKEWFSMLVSDNFEVRLDDDFTPVIEQQDYDIEYNYLSGGERTAIALAYRLALNQVINSLMSKIKTRDLIILDEPTDGFSDAQLDKMRDVLQELNVSQLIIVSHERKVEDFVENVIKLRKENGLSKKF